MAIASVRTVTVSDELKQLLNQNSESEDEKGNLPHTIMQTILRQCFQIIFSILTILLRCCSLRKMQFLYSDKYSTYGKYLGKAF
jgi:lipopolysaccharide/colanic/teichoic acid biosynthesis glycosyltransferase